MEHLALYRKYRPQNFDEVIGQSHITQTLLNQIKTGNISHAYLFCGTRGTGKTSIAKIFARAINCENISESGKVCGKCEACVALANPSNLDIMEIDAASNNGVDSIRDIREKIKYTPVNCKYKIYIIDEVHMLSDSAFNALLKTLEEPPAHAIFILATTEEQKIPATIASRCVKFDFKLVETEELAKHIAKIFDKENIFYEKEAVNLIASLGEGSVRDALSVAEMCVAYSNGKVTYENSVKAIGITDRETLNQIAENIINKNQSQLINVVDGVYKSGKNIAQLSKDMLNYFRDLMIVKSTDNAKDLLKLPTNVFDKMKELSANVSNENLLDILTKLCGLEQEFRFTQNAKTLFEVTILNLLSDSDYSKLEKRVTQIENKLKTLVNP